MQQPNSAPSRRRAAPAPQPEAQPASTGTNLAERADVKAIAAETEQLELTAKTYIVANVVQYEAAGLQLQQVKGAQKRLEELRMSITRPMDAAKKAVMSLFAGPEAKLEVAERSIKRAMLGFQQEQERKRLADQAIADAAARKERERIEAQAQRAAASGKTEKAEALQERAAQVVAPIVNRDPPRIAGVNTVKQWKFVVEDSSLVPREYCTVDETKIRKVVLALKGDTRIAGVRVYSEDNIAAGAA